MPGRGNQFTRKPEAKGFSVGDNRRDQSSKQETPYDGYRYTIQEQQGGPSTRDDAQGASSLEQATDVGGGESYDIMALLWEQTERDLAELRGTQPDKQEESELTEKQVVSMITSTKKDTEDAKNLGIEYRNMVSEQELQDVIQKMEGYMEVARKNINTARENLLLDNSVSMENSLKELIIISRKAIEEAKTTKWLINKDIK